jgi:hypothetical protein
MKKIIYTLVIIVSIITSACTKYDANGNIIKSYDELQKAKWLLGEWEKSDSLGILKETWISKDDSTFFGQSYYIQNKKDTLHDEQIELVQDGEHLIYKTTVKGENNDAPIPFQMTKDEDSLLVFENPKHDYPQKIQYKLLKNGSLIATVSGKQNGKNSSKNYPMTRKK